ncbi:MAG TPA: hypothetical protein VGZ29_07150 [Terriglobia bacterium]|nr:hypothetical protein [Terriglobia bacterium]
MLRRIHLSAAALLIATFQLPAAHAGQLQTKPPLGQIVRSSSATLGGTAIPAGGTIVSGDIMSIAAGGGALVEFPGGNQIDLGENTIVTFSGTPDHVVATVDHGNVTVRAPAAGGVVVETVRCRIASTGQGGASYQVTAPPGSTSISVHGLQGAVSVGELGAAQAHALKAGEDWSCPAVAAGRAREEGAPSAGEQAGQAGAPAVSSHSNTGLIVLLLGGGAAVGIGAALAAGGKGGGGGGPASPSAP